MLKKDLLTVHAKLKCSNWRVELTATCHLLCEGYLFFANITLLFDIFRVFFVVITMVIAIDAAMTPSCFWYPTNKIYTN